jgi:penicillin-binding protein 2
MNSIHRIFKFTSVLFLLFTIFTSQIALGATRNRARAEKRSRRAEQGAPRGRRAEMMRQAAQRRAEAARQAAIARERAADEGIRSRVQDLIAKDDTTGEDLEIRRIAINALGHHAGTVVVMDPQTGRVYTVVNQQWALREGVKPCSTIKLVTGLAGLNEKVIDSADTTTISYANKMTLTNAIAHSNNAYFQQVGGQVGFSKMVSYARQLGLGEKTGINARNESQGRVPMAKTGFAVNHMSSHGDDFKVTAMQLATLVSAMANGGKLLTPFVPRTAQDQTRTAPKVRRTLNISSDSLKHMVPGMLGAVNYGTARRAYNSQELIAGKTGTCIEGGWVGLFTSYAPLNNPRLAIAVIGRGADGQHHFPVTVAGRIYRDLNGRFGTTFEDPQIAKSLKSQMTDISLGQTANAAAEKDVTDADDEESDQADDDKSTVVVAQKMDSSTNLLSSSRKPADSKVKRTSLQLDNRPAPAKKLTAERKTLTLTEPKFAQRPRRVNAVQK